MVQDTVEDIAEWGDKVVERPPVRRLEEITDPAERAEREHLRESIRARLAHRKP